MPNFTRPEMPAPSNRRARMRASVVLAVLSVLSLLTACSQAFSRKYEYEEDVYLRLDGSATVYVNASVPALVALRGVELPMDPAARMDRQRVRELFTSPELTVENVSLSRRDGRRYVHVRLEAPDVRRLGAVAPFAWSAYALAPSASGDVSYRQILGPSANRPVGDVGWTGRELVAFRLHLPSRVTFENSASTDVERGNIIAWEQPLVARLHGEPLAIEVRMERQSILARTLTLFGSMIALAAATFAVGIWLIARRGQREASAKLKLQRTK